MQEQPADPRDRELMDALGTLKLPPPGVSQRDIWYCAGKDAGRKHVTAWKALAAAVTLSAGLAFVWDRRPAPTPQVIYVKHLENSAASNGLSPETATASLAYERMRDRLIEEGLSGLPAIDFTGNSGPSSAAGERDSGDRQDPLRELWHH